MSLDIGGAETHIVELAAELKRRGIEVIIASNGGVYVSELEAAGIKHFNVPMNRRNVSCMIKSYFLMRKLIKRESPDIVHAHARIPGFICGLLHKTLKIRRTDMVAQVKISSAECKNSETGRRNSGPGRKMKFSFVTTAHWVFELGRGLKYLTNWGEKIIAVSQDIKTYLTENYGVSEGDIFVTINSINTQKFSPDVSGQDIRKEFDIPPDAPVVLTIGRLDEIGTRVGIVAERLIVAAPELSKNIPNLRIIITGKAVMSDGTFEKTLYKKAAEVNAELGYNAVIMTGARTDVEKILAACDLFVGVSRAALEAMATQKPVILAGGEGYIGLFTEDKLDAALKTNFCCRAFPETTKDLLLNDITDFFAKPASETAPLGDFGRKLIIADFSPAKMVDDCIAAYKAAYRPKYNVVMSGYYGFKNVGDEAILQSIYENILEISDDVSITVLSKDPQDTTSRYGYEAVNSFNIFSVFKAIRRSDALISGGGSLLQDVTSTRSLIYYLFIIRMAKVCGKKVMLYANGIGPVRRKDNRRRVARVISGTDVITLRDKASLEELKAMGVKRDDMRVTADPVFTMKGITKEDARAVAGIPQEPFITVSIRNWPNMDNFCDDIASICDYLYENKKREIVFISMHSDRDIGISKKVAGLMKNPSHIIATRLSAQQLIGVVGLSDIVIAMRLHALIFAARMNVPFTSIMYDPKVSAYTNELCMPAAGDVASFDKKTAFEAIMKLLENRDEYAEVLGQKTEKLCNAALEDAKLLVEMLKQ